MKVFHIELSFDYNIQSHDKFAEWVTVEADRTIGLLVRWYVQTATKIHVFDLSVNIYEHTRSIR